MIAANPDLLRIMARVRAEGLVLADEAITPDERMASWRGFSLFCARQLKVLDRERRLVPFRLNWIQRQLVAHEIRSRRAGVSPYFLILKYRKGGVTTLQQAINYWTIWRRMHQECLTLAHEPDAAKMIFRMVTRFYRFQPLTQRHVKTPASVDHIEFPLWDGVYSVGTAGRGGLGRGRTLSRLHLSEAAWYTDLRATHSALAEALATSSAYAIETTPNGRDGRGGAFYDMWQAAKAGQSIFTPLFFPWHADPANRLPLAAPDELGELDGFEQEIQKKYKLGLEQLKWYRYQRLRIIADGRGGDILLQEHPLDDESCFLFGTRGYFDREALALMMGKCRPPIAVENDGRLRIWEMPKAGAVYSIGADPSGGVGGDNAAVVGFNVLTGEQAFTWSDNHCIPDELGYRIIGDRTHGLGWRWGNAGTGQPAFVVVERDNHGHATLAGLLKIADYPRESVYHHIDELKDDPRQTPAKVPGWPQGGGSHVIFTGVAGKMIRDGYPHVRDAAVVRSYQSIAAGAAGPEWTGRDEATAATLAFIGFEQAREIASDLLFIGGRLQSL